ncbi:DNA cytosine methyltransferase [Streptomyces galilaeus]
MSTPRPLIPQPITVLDLFSGCGGFTQGFHEFRPEGAADGGPVFRSVAAVEHDLAAAATYAANFGSHKSDDRLPPARVHLEDIEDWKPTDEALHADVVVGGPPCQGFSALNRHKKGSERNRLWEEYVRIVSRIRPKIFVIENVDRFLKSDEFLNLLSEVKTGGLLSDYRLINPPGHEPGEIEEKKHKRYLLNAADYGAVQARRRAIVIGVRKDVDGNLAMKYPSATHTRHRKHSNAIPAQPLDGVDLEPSYWRAVDSVFNESNLLEIRGTELPDGKEYVPDVDSVLPGVFTTSDLHFGRNPEPLSRARYRAIPKGGNRKT